MFVDAKNVKFETDIADAHVILSLSVLYMLTAFYLKHSMRAFSD